MKTGQWYHGGMARPVGLDVDTASGSETASTKTDISPSTEKRPKFNESGHTSSEKENYEKSEKPQMARQSSQLRRQYSLDAQREKTVENKDPSSERMGGGKGSDTLRERGQNIPIPAERGRNRDKSPARHRYHSESRLSETDKRFMAHERGSESDRHTGRPREALGPRQMDNREKGRHLDERDGRRGHDKDRKEPLHPDRDIIKKETSTRVRYVFTRCKT